MPDISPNLSLPYLQPSQAQKHVTHNEALRRLDALVQLAIRSTDGYQPPATPEEGEIYAIGTGATEAWAGQDGKLAIRTDADWAFITPQEGWRAWDSQSGTLRVYSAGSWLEVTPNLQNLAGLGINATSDATNRLAVAADATLFNHDGDDHRLTINKARTSNTASLIMQSSWSGRAEMGLTGNDDFHIRTSPDGSTWTTALNIQSADAVT